MVSVKVENGTINTSFRVEETQPIHEELGHAISQLLADFANELIKMGNSREVVDALVMEVVGSVIRMHPQRLAARNTVTSAAPAQNILN